MVNCQRCDNPIREGYTHIAYRKMNQDGTWYMIQGTCIEVCVA